jgi:nucleoside-diphosphate-sugar epimerase
VLATDIRETPTGLLEGGPYARVDVTDAGAVRGAIERHRADTVFHMAAILSATGERKPDVCWDVNLNGTRNVLEAARELGLERVIIPSSIAVFGPETPKDGTPQNTIMLPRTMYGVTKVAGELLGAYYREHFGVDVRGVRFPGIISSETAPGGGTTDYAVEIYVEAIKSGRYTCFVRASTTLPMMYMPDAIRSLITLAEADGSRLRHATGYNLAAMSFSAEELAASIAAQVPGFEVTYAPDHRQAFADSWPRSIDDAVAREEWGWEPEFDLERMTLDMLTRLRARMG